MRYRAAGPADAPAIVFFHQTASSGAMWEGVMTRLAASYLAVARFHACGHHTGGCIALELPGLLAGPIETLAIIGPVLVNEAEKIEYRKTFVRPFAAEQSGAFLQTAWDYLRMIGAGANLDLHVRETIDHLIAHRTMPMAFTAVWEQDVEALLRGVDVPLLLMCSDTDVLRPLFDRACALRPDAANALTGGADYEPDLDADGVAAALTRFLQR